MTYVLLFSGYPAYCDRFSSLSYRLAANPQKSGVSTSFTLFLHVIFILKLHTSIIHYIIIRNLVMVTLSLYRHYCKTCKSIKRQKCQPSIKLNPCDADWVSRWPTRIDASRKVDPISPRRRRFSAGLHATDTLAAHALHIDFNFIIYNGTLPPRFLVVLGNMSERSRCWALKRYKRTMSIISSTFLNGCRTSRRKELVKGKIIHTPIAIDDASCLTWHSLIQVGYCSQHVRQVQT